MLAAPFCRRVYFVVLPSDTMASRVPRCLFGKPDPRETVEMLQEALEAERSKFRKRWGVDPRSEDKENNYQRHTNDRNESSPGNRKRCNPYSRQSNIHDYWRARKVCDVNKKPLASSIDASKQQNVGSPRATRTTLATTSTAMTAPIATMKAAKKTASN